MLTEALRGMKPTHDDLKPKHNIFSQIKLDKPDGFPALYVDRSGTSSRLDADEALMWKNDISNWASAHGINGIFALTEKIVRLSPDGSARLPLFPDNPDWEDLHASFYGMRALLIMISETSFGVSLKIPSREKIMAMDEDSIRCFAADFFNVSKTLLFRLTQSTRSPKDNITVMPEVCAGFNKALNTDNGEQHPLAGFILLALIDNIHARNPAGTAFQMKDKLITYIRKLPSDDKFTVFKILPLLNEVNLKMANICAKEPEFITQLHREVLHVLNDTLRQVCRKAYIENAGKNSSELNNAAETAAHHMMQWSQDRNITWHTFQMQLTAILSNNLPPAPAADAGKPAKDALALSAQHKQQGFKGNRNRNGDAPPPEDWVCNKCGRKNHYAHQCPNPYNPEAEKLVEKAKKARIEARKLREEQSKKRKRIQAANDKLDEDSTPTPAKKSKQDAADSQKRDGKKVTAGLAMNLECDEEAGDTRTVYTTAQMALVYQTESCVYIDELPLLTRLAIVYLPSFLRPTIVRIHDVACAHLRLILSVCMVITIAAVCYCTYIVHQHAQKMDEIAAALFVFATYALYAGMIVLDRIENSFSDIWGAVYGAVQRVPRNLRGVYLDSGCTKSVFGNQHKLINVRPTDRNYRIVGVGGEIIVTKMGDFPLALRSDDGKTHVVVIKDCLIAPDAFTNLLAARDVSQAGLEFVVPAGGKEAQLILRTEKGTATFKLQHENGLYQLPYYKDVMTHFAGVCSHQLRALTEHEIWHRRLGHIGAQKLAALSKHCKGMPPMTERDLVCHQCHEGKARRQPYPDASSN